MGYLPYSTRRIPIPGSGSSELILTVPRRASFGGDGHFAAARLHPTGAGTTTTAVIHNTNGVDWSEFESGFLTIAARCEGLRMIVQGREVTVTDHTYAAPDATLTFTPAVPTATAANDLIWLGSDIPPYVAQLLLKTDGADLQVNTRKAGLIANGIFMTLLNGESLMVVDTEAGTPGKSVYVRAAAAGTTTMGFHAMVP